MRAVFGVRIRHLLVLTPLLSLQAAIGFGADKAADPIPPLEVRGYALAANQDQPSLCFTLSQTIARRPDAPLESFVATEPAIKLAATPRNNRLCLTGFAFGTGYSVSLKPGLPGVSSPLGKEWGRWIQVPNRPPEFDFAGPLDGVLPRAGNDGLPLRSVNVGKIDVDIFHVSDEDLLFMSPRMPLTTKEAEAFAPSHGERVWHGTVEPKGSPNTDTVTAMPVQKSINPLKPGLYVAVARQDDFPEDPKATLPTRYFTISDLGVAAYRGADSLAVSVRSLTTANAATGVDIALIGRNNRELARVRTDDNGFARFDANSLQGNGGDAPTAIRAYGQPGDFAAIMLEPSGADDAAPDIRAAFYPDRDAYRPGDIVHALILLRTVEGGPAQKAPLVVDIFRPDGTLFQSQTLSDEGAGGYELAFTLPAPEAAGTWRLAARPGSGQPAVGSLKLAVSAALPRLAAAVSSDAALLDPTLASNLSVEGQYPEGPAAATPGELRATVTAAPVPFPAFPDFAFGLPDESDGPIAVEPARFTTDAAGKASVPLKITAPPTPTKPLEAIVTARLFDAGGQPVERSATFPVATQNLLLGVRAAPGPVFTEQQPAHFEVIAVSPDGARQEKAGVGWEVLRQDAAPSWVWNNGRFVFRPVVKDTHVAGGTLDIPANSPAQLDTALLAGRYRIEVFDPTGEAVSSTRFIVGWTAPVPGDTTDTVEIKPAKETYTPGESTEVFVKPPFEADVTLVAADPRLRNTAVQHIPAAGGAMHIDMPQDSGLSMRLLATAVAPAIPIAPNLTRRAFGTTTIAADPAARSLDVKLDLPQTAAPENTLAVPVTVSGAGEDPVFLQVTAVDAPEPEGGFPTSDTPLAPFAAAGISGVRTADTYDRIITSSGLSNGPIGIAAAGKDAGRSAGWEPAGREQSRPARPSVAVYSGIVTLDKSGKASVPLTLPDFTGKLHVKVIAWSANKAATANATLSVSDPLTADLPLPKILSPEDRADLTLKLDNVEGPRGEYRVKLAAEGHIALQGDSEIVANLAEHEQRSQPVTILAKDEGDGSITMSVVGPNGIGFERHLAVKVAATSPLVARHAQLTLKPGAALAADPALTAGLRPESIGASMTLGSGIDFDLNGLAAELTARPFTSAETLIGDMTVYLSASAELKYLARDDDPGARLIADVQTLAGYQTSDGGFSRWPGGTSDPWLSAETVDLLLRCKKAGVAVPEAMMDQGTAYLAVILAPATSGSADIAALPPSTIAEAAYAAKVLAAAGQLNLFQQRYFSDRVQPSVRDPITLGLIASSFAILGDKAAAAATFARATATAEPTAAIRSELEDQAGLAALMIESDAVAQSTVATFVAKLSVIAGNHRQLSAPEATWLFRAAAPLPRSEGAIKAKVNEDTLQDDHAIWKSTNGIPAIKNLGDKPLHISLTVTGAPAQTEVREQGFELQRAFFDATGKPVDPTTLRQNDLMIVVLSGRFAGQGEVQPLLMDPLPAGWRVEAAEIVDPANRYPWLKDLGGARYALAESGKYIAVPNLTGDRHEFKIAYVVRATVRGQFALPGSIVQDLAQPTQYARGGAGKTKIDPAS
jgi:uncharacterized protein YfaS (alpha-2-macroglobulin family)